MQVRNVERVLAVTFELNRVYLVGGPDCEDMFDACDSLEVVQLWLVMRMRADGLITFGPLKARITSMDVEDDDGLTFSFEGVFEDEDSLPPMLKQFARGFFGMIRFDDGRPNGVINPLW